MNDGWTRHFDENTQSWASTNMETGETRYEDDSEEPRQLDEAPLNDEYRLVSIVRRKGGDPAFKHWALFVADQDGDSEGFECEIEGSRKRFTYAESRASANSSAATLDMHPVGYVDTEISRTSETLRGRQGYIMRMNTGAVRILCGHLWRSWRRRGCLSTAMTLRGRGGRFMS